MKKVLLSIFAMLAMPMLAIAEPLYTVEAQAVEDADWSEDYDYMAAQGTAPITVEAYADYFIIRSWTGIEGYDLRVEYDEENNVTDMQAIIDGEVAASVENYYLRTNTGSDDFYSVDITVYPYYCIAGCDAEGGYLTFVGYWYSEENPDGLSAYYNIEWVAPDAPAYNYACEAEAVEDADWSAGMDYVPAEGTAPIMVESYDGYIIVRSWMGFEGYDLRVEFDENQAITAMDAIVNGEVVASLDEDYLSTYTGSDNYFYTNLYAAPGYAYAYSDVEGGYLTISGYFYYNDEEADEDAETPSIWGYYNLEWSTGVSVEGVTYDTVAYSINDEDWDEWYNAYNLGEAVNTTVDTGEKTIALHDFLGVEGVELTITYDIKENITNMVVTNNGEEIAALDDDVLYFETGDEHYFYAVIHADDSYASADETSGYVFLMMDLYYDYDSDPDTYYYYLAFGEEEEEAIQGDVDGDGNVTVTDVTSLIDAVLNGTDNPAADVDGDGTISVTDITKLIDIILNN